MRRLRALALAAVVAASGMDARADVAAEDGTGPIELHQISGEDRIAFAVKFFHKHFPNVTNWSFSSGRRSQEDWATVVLNRAQTAEVDLGGNGAPQWIVVIDDPNWCDQLGCLGAIFRKYRNTYENICQAPLPGAGQPPATVMKDVENGYRRIVTPTRWIEWNPAQEFDSGTLCAVEEPER